MSDTPVTEALLDFVSKLRRYGTRIYTLRLSRHAFFCLCHESKKRAGDRPVELGEDVVHLRLRTSAGRLDVYPDPPILHPTAGRCMFDGTTIVFEDADRATMFRVDLDAGEITVDD